MEDDNKTKKDFENFLSRTGLIRQDAGESLGELKVQ
jgi:hypothetical protein